MLYFLHILCRQATELVFEPCFAGRRELVGHSFSRVAVERDVSLTGTEPVYVAGDGHYLNTVEVLVGSVVADDDGGPLLAYLAA